MERVAEPVAEPEGERPAGVTALALLALLDGLTRFVGGGAPWARVESVSSSP
jgi:hypothetical protein